MKITTEQLLKDIKNFKAGTKIELTGTIYTARDQAHKRLVELLNSNKELPIQLKDLQHLQEWMYIHRKCLITVLRFL